MLGSSTRQFTASPHRFAEPYCRLAWYEYSVHIRDDDANLPASVSNTLLMNSMPTARFDRAFQDIPVPAASILVLDDDTSRGEELKISLQAERFSVTVLRRSSEAINHIADHPPDLILLYFPFLPVSGIELLRQIREPGCSALVLVLSPRNEEVDKVQAFRVGADDYVVTPVGLLELIARIGALLRRVVQSAPHVTEPHDTVQFGQVIVNRSTRGVTHAGRIVNLTPREFDLLDYLLEANGRIVSRTTIMRHVWRYATGIASRTIDQHIARLRFKLEPDPLHPVHVLTVRKAGYRLRRVSETGAAASIPVVGNMKMVSSAHSPS